MAQVPVEVLLESCKGSIYKVVLLAAKRAKELASGSPALIPARGARATVVALEEIVRGKVKYGPVDSEEESGKRTPRKTAKKRVAS